MLRLVLVAAQDELVEQVIDAQLDLEEQIVDLLERHVNLIVTMRRSDEAVQDVLDSLGVDRQPQQGRARSNGASR